MNTATTTAQMSVADSMAGYRFVTWALGQAIFWMVIARALMLWLSDRARAALAATEEMAPAPEPRCESKVVASAPTAPPLPAEPEPDEEPEQPRPAAQFTDEVMAAIREQAKQEIGLVTAHPTPERASTRVGVEALCVYCWNAEAEMAETWPSLRPLYDVEWIVCAHHKRAYQQVKDAATASGMFPTQVYFLDLPRPRYELN